MTALTLAAAFFVGIHLLVAGTRARDRLIGWLGERTYFGLFSAAALGGIVAMGWAYNRAPLLPLWDLGVGAKHAAAFLVLLGFLLAVLGLTTRNPTAVGGEAGMAKQPSGVIAITRHPFLWGVLLWALAHLLANGDAASLVLFGAFGLLALVGPFSLDAKKARLRPEAWRGFAAATSWLPFLAMAQGRARLRLAELGWWRPALAIALYLVFAFVLHEWLFSVKPF